LGVGNWVGVFGGFGGAVSVSVWASASAAGNKAASAMKGIRRMGQIKEEEGRMSIA
jgi:hypothetical protein